MTFFRLLRSFSHTIIDILLMFYHRWRTSVSPLRASSSPRILGYFPGSLYTENNSALVSLKQTYSWQQGLFFFPSTWAEFANFPDPSLVPLISMLSLVVVRAKVLCFHWNPGSGGVCKRHFRCGGLACASRLPWKPDVSEATVTTCDLTSSTGPAFRCLGLRWGCASRRWRLDRPRVWGDKGIRFQVASFPLWGSVPPLSRR